MVPYLAYELSTTKGQVTAGQEYNTPFKLSKVDVNYTGARVVESKAAGSSTKFTALAWSPYVKGVFENGGTAYDVKIIVGTDPATTAYGYINPTDGKVYTDAAYTTEYSSNTADKVAYVYDNVIVPQKDLPRLNVEMRYVTLEAKPRRVAVAFSQLAEFQARQDYGFNLADSLKVQAAGLVASQIDNEIIETLDETAGTADSDLIWSRTLPIGVNKRDQYL